MLIISLVNTKGGAGKTTIALVTALTAADAGYSVCVFDLDTNKDFSDFQITRQKLGLDSPFDIYQLNSNEHNIAKEMERILKDPANNYDLVIIDTPGHMTGDLNYALLKADLVLFPIKSNKNEVRHGEHLSRAIAKLADRHDTVVDYAFVFSNQNDLANPVSLRLASEFLQENDLPILPVALKTRATFTLIGFWGLTMREIAEGMEVKDGKILDPKQKKTPKERSRHKAARKTARNAQLAANEFTEGLIDYAYAIKVGHQNSQDNTDTQNLKAS